MAGFADQIAAWSEKTREKLETAVRKIALDAFTEVILMSPVDTGRFRGNWQVAIGNIPTGTVEIDDKTGTATIGKVQAETLKLQAGQTIFLVNNLPYAQALEYGHSQQAPGGMVRLTAQRFTPIVDAVARELNKG
ncbi:HK97 gp10 family phage protein [Aureimonas populi]|uniref:HK97 gp10 family phage protein n=1 Tax=Aureimonas populi TaxID=1701758 RepID=A0ABW5CIN8_9HYPH|nr:HK97 gp10 family phage protein [Aureimonas populi]